MSETTDKSTFLLQNAIANTKHLSPDNHDEVRISIALANADSAKKISEGLDRVSLNLADQVGRIIQSNEKLSESNDRHASANLFLAKVLIAVTVVVGVIQAVVTLVRG